MAIAVVQVERGGRDVRGRAEPDHGERDVRVDPDDHGAGAAEAGHPGQVSQGVRGEGVEHIDRCEVDDDAVTAIPADLLDEVVLEPGELSVVERRVDGRDQVTALPEDGDERRLLAGVVGHGFLPPGRGNAGARHHPGGRWYRAVRQGCPGCVRATPSNQVFWDLPTYPRIPSSRFRRAAIWVTIAFTPVGAFSNFAIAHNRLPSRFPAPTVR